MKPTLDFDWRDVEDLLAAWSYVVFQRPLSATFYKWIGLVDAEGFDIAGAHRQVLYIFTMRHLGKFFILRCREDAIDWVFWTNIVVFSYRYQASAWIGTCLSLYGNI